MRFWSISNSAHEHSGGTRPAETPSTSIHLLRALGASALLALAVPALASAQSFVDISAGLTNVHHGNGLWGDYDGDGQLDALVTGETVSPLGEFSDIYANNSGTFTPLSAGLMPIAGSTGISYSAWGDYDNDGDLDVVVIGLSGGASMTTLYENTPGGFVPVTVSPSALIGVSGGSASWADYDNDGDLDLLIMGYGGPQVALYRNDGPAAGGWTFTNTTPPSSSAYPAILPEGWSDAAWGDYDNDGDLDLAVTGYQASGINAYTRIYRNDGGALVNSGISNLVNVGLGAVAWGDCNNDGYLDLAVMGAEYQTGPRHFVVYTNNGNGTFSAATTFTGIANGSLSWGDYNNDGNLDLLATGATVLYPTASPTTKLYKGNGNGTFTEDLTSGLINVYEGQASFGDYDNDGRLDIILTGRQAANNTAFTKVYHNNTGVTANTAPSVPTGLTATAVTASSITMYWNLSTDAETPQPTIHYNIAVTDQTAGTTVMSPMSDVTTGTRYVAQLGNTNHNANWSIGGLTPGHTYNVCVQAIDQAYKASAFNCGLTVTTPANDPDVMIGDCTGDVGTEPNTACGSTYWTSPNIWVRQALDGGLVDQLPVGGGTNYVYVRVKNIGPALLPGGKVLVYYAKGSTGLSWPLTWNAYSIGGVPYGDYIGYANVPPLSGGGGTAIVSVTWYNTPDPANYSDPDAHHFCLLARFVSPGDPMTYAEGYDVGVNTQNNNNIAWKNTAILNSDGTGPKAPIEVHNIYAEAIATDLQFTVPDEEKNDPILNHVKIKVDLGHDLFQKWRDGGSRGTGIEEVKDGGDANTAVWITDIRATLEGIRLEPDEQLTAHVEAVYSADFDDKVAGKVYSIDMSQHISGQDVSFGGETFLVEMPARPAGKPALPQGDLTRTLQLTARPNPTNGTTAISYMLPADTRVTVALYDAAGALVRTLVAPSQQKSGGHEIQWDGNAANGTPVASGTYFYRVETTGGTAQGQLKVVR